MDPFPGTGSSCLSSGVLTASGLCEDDQQRDQGPGYERADQTQYHSFQHV